MSWISNLIEQIKHTTYVCFLATPSDAPAALEKARWKKHCLEKTRWKKHREVAGAFKGYIPGVKGQMTRCHVEMGRRKDHHNIPKTSS